MTDLEIPYTLCPYLVRPLGTDFETNREHILPDALGAPDGFVLIASKQENSRLNDLIDAEFVNDPLIRTLSAIKEVKSRSGPVVARMHGTTSSGDEIFANFSPREFVPRFRSPIIKDEDGNAIGVQGFPGQIEAEARKFLEGQRRRGRSGLLVPIEPVSGPFDFSVVGNWDVIWRGIVKTAYLTTVWAFGDHAIRSETGAAYRRWMAIGPGEEFDRDVLVGEVINPEFPDFFPRLEHHEHALYATLQEDGLHTIIKLFGGIGLHLVTPRSDVDLPDGLRRGCVIDSRKASISPLEIGGASGAGKPGEAGAPDHA